MDIFQEMLRREELFDIIASHLECSGFHTEYAPDIIPLVIEVYADRWKDNPLNALLIRYTTHRNDSLVITTTIPNQVLHVDLLDPDSIATIEKIVRQWLLLRSCH